MLQQPSIVKKAIGRAIIGTSATLRGYRRKTVNYYGKSCFVIVADAHFSVKGQVLAVSKKELHLLDDYEYCIYLRKRVHLTNGKYVWVYALRDEERF